MFVQYSVPKALVFANSTNRHLVAGAGLEPAILH